MFQITSYLQYRNTPNGKPRVLREGVDYNTVCDEFLFDCLLSFETDLSGETKRTDGKFEFETTTLVASLYVCHPLVSVEIKGKELRSLTVRYSKQFNSYQLLYFNGLTWNVEGLSNPKELHEEFLKFVVEDELYYFESDPKKYSQLLWNCSEEEGWEKVLELLGVNK